MSSDDKGAAVDKIWEHREVRNDNKKVLSGV
jgi:hypothetical protein